MENDTHKNDDLSESQQDLTETPLFMRTREWWRAKKVSLDLWGFEKYLGCDNTQFKAAIAQYKNLLQEVEMEYKESVKSADMTPEELEEAKERRQMMLLDAKKDFVYHMPEDYRIWFKKRRIFSSWRNAPENWGFEETRYWGSRSGLTLKERRVFLLGSIAGLVIIVLVAYGITTYEKKEASVDKVFKYEKDKNVNIDSTLIAQAKLEEKKRIQEETVVRNNALVDQLNAGYYMSNSYNITEEVRLIMQIYYERQEKKIVQAWDIRKEAVGVALFGIAANNPNVITQKDAYGNPLGWKPNTKIVMTWGDIQAGIQENNKYLRGKK